MPKLKIEDFDKNMQSIIQRPRRQAESKGLLDILRKAAQKRRPASRFPPTPGRVV